MARLRRFEDHRFVGDRATMTVYDCDDDTQYAELERRVSDSNLYQQNLLQTFAPDDLSEARNRGFSPVA
jgi:hypothetical protein